MLPIEGNPIDIEAADWVVRLNKGRVADETVALFDQWYAADTRHQGAYLRAEAAWMMLDRAQVMSHGDAVQANGTLRHSQAKYQTLRTRRFLLGAGAAASMAAAVGVGFVLKSRLSFATGMGELRKVPLADRSLAAVNTDSQIDVAMTDHIRHVQLVKGEAWFEVAKNPDAPFVVSAGDVRVRALGTAFSVRRHKGGVDVLVTEGTVEVWNVKDMAKRVSLTAGAEAFVSESFVSGAAQSVAVSYQPEQVERKLAWREREIILNDETLADAVAEFNRYNSRQIVISDPALNSQKFVGGFQVDQPDSFARAVHTALGVPVSISDDRIQIGTVSSAL